MKTRIAYVCLTITNTILMIIQNVLNQPIMAFINMICAYLCIKELYKLYKLPKLRVLKIGSCSKLRRREKKMLKKMCDSLNVPQGVIMDVRSIKPSDFINNKNLRNESLDWALTCVLPTEEECFNEDINMIKKYILEAFENRVKKNRNT